MLDLVRNKEKFLRLARQFIHRDGIENLLAWLERSDFFVAPASTQYNLPVEGGLCCHALNLVDLLCKRYYGCDVDSLTQEQIEMELPNEMTIESIIIVGLFSNIYKANCYAKDFKNVKVNGKWEQQEYWRWNEQFLYSGRGSKSVYIIQQYMKLYIEEAQAIAFHLAGEDNIFSGIIDQTYKKIYETSPFALGLHLAEMEATYFLDNTFLL